MLILKSYEDLLKEIESVFNLLSYTFMSSMETEKFIVLMDKIEEDKASPYDLLELFNISMIIKDIETDKWVQIKSLLYIQILCYYAKHYAKEMSLNKVISINNNPKKDDVVIYMNNLYLVTDDSKETPKIRPLFRKEASGYYWKIEDESDLLIVIGKLENKGA